MAKISQALARDSKGGREMRNEKMLPAVPENAALIAETGKNVAELVSGMRAMAEMLRVSNERMAAMEEEMRGLREAVRTLEKVTPAQAATINRLIRQRAEEICEEYRMGVTIDHRADGLGVPGVRVWETDPGRLKAMTAVIRADVREMTGARTVREIARCDWETAVDYITGWDDYDKIMTVKAGKRVAR